MLHFAVIYYGDSVTTATASTYKGLEEQIERLTLLGGEVIDRFSRSNPKEARLSDFKDQNSLMNYFCFVFSKDADYLREIHSRYGMRDVMKNLAQISYALNYSNNVVREAYLYFVHEEGSMPLGVQKTTY